MNTIDNIITSKIELVFGSIDASSGQDATSFRANSERVDRLGSTASLENVSEWISTLHVLNTKDETRRNISNEVSELSVTGTHFDRQAHNYRINLALIEPKNFIQNTQK